MWKGYLIIPIAAQSLVGYCHGNRAVQDRYPFTRVLTSIRCSQCMSNRSLLPANIIAALFTAEAAVAFIVFYFIAEQG